ncbi:DUF3726 domain-containing protein [Mesobacterium sp. TK19101]|uniref:DUF3726 domain-containing protein n=1 Tax=Mesobacterium hydrothermale TaxID=3111907 RepID=A0ABU6HGX9_9RHOB|nr:DUF3726 domain-containing protein [Mesobacterium sp. TK19101]MEC3861100.1 DUF3726 domain-containing protein [Mesobacterium sp. TK19101]
MTLSLNEIDAQAKRAARGAGYSWGMAEEAGKAARWLCAQGLDGVSVLAQALTRDGTALTRGVAMADRAVRLHDEPATLMDVPCPALVLPFAAMAARQLRAGVSVDLDSALAVTDGDRLQLSGPLPDHAACVRVTLGGALSTPVPRLGRASPTPEAWATLTRLAALTYAPATDESRLRGAGAGLSDND